jgi:hypothetical protein
MWTAHVVNGRVASLDPLDGVQQPRQPAPFAHGVAPAAADPAVGPGTRALQEMAAARPRPRWRSIPITSEPRISTVGAVGVFLLALLLFLTGVYFFRQGVFTVNPPRPIVSRTMTFAQPDYRVVLPSSWPAREASGDFFDAVYSVPDREILNVAVVDFADASLSDPTARDQHLGLASDMVAGAIGTNPVLVERTFVKLGGKTLRVSTYNITDASGIVTRVREYLSVGLDRAVIVTAYGTLDAVDRHDTDVARVASSAVIH